MTLNKDFQLASVLSFQIQGEEKSTLPLPNQNVFMVKVNDLVPNSFIFTIVFSFKYLLAWEGSWFSQVIKILKFNTPRNLEDRNYFKQNIYFQKK